MKKKLLVAGERNKGSEKLHAGYQKSGNRMKW